VSLSCCRLPTRAFKSLAVAQSVQLSLGMLRNICFPVSCNYAVTHRWTRCIPTCASLHKPAISGEGAQHRPSPRPSSSMPNSYSAELQPTFWHSRQQWGGDDGARGPPHGFGPLLQCFGVFAGMPVATCFQSSVRPVQPLPILLNSPLTTHKTSKALRAQQCSQH